MNKLFQIIGLLIFLTSCSSNWIEPAQDLFDQSNQLINKYYAEVDCPQNSITNKFDEKVFSDTLVIDFLKDSSVLEFWMRPVNKENLYYIDNEKFKKMGEKLENDFNLCKKGSHEWQPVDNNILRIRDVSIDVTIWYCECQYSTLNKKNIIEITGKSIVKNNLEYGIVFYYLLKIADD